MELKKDQIIYEELAKKKEKIEQRLKELEGKNEN